MNPTKKSAPETAQDTSLLPSSSLASGSGERGVLSGYCQCGCGIATKRCRGGDKRIGLKPGDHYRFAPGHNQAFRFKHSPGVCAARAARRENLRNRILRGEDVAREFGNNATYQCFRRRTLGLPPAWREIGRRPYWEDVVAANKAKEAARFHRYQTEPLIFSIFIADERRFEKRFDEELKKRQDRQYKFAAKTQTRLADAIIEELNKLEKCDRNREAKLERQERVGRAFLAETSSFLRLDNSGVYGSERNLHERIASHCHTPLTDLISKEEAEEEVRFQRYAERAHNKEWEPTTFSPFDALRHRKEKTVILPEDFYERNFRRENYPDLWPSDADTHKL